MRRLEGSTNDGRCSSSASTAEEDRLRDSNGTCNIWTNASEMRLGMKSEKDAMQIITGNPLARRLNVISAKSLFNWAACCSV
jgi:galactose mutarotase-like enzyme